MKRSPNVANRNAAPRKLQIPREFLPLTAMFARDSYEQFQVWVYAMALLMVDEERVRQVGARQVAGKHWMTLQIYGGEEFEIVKPPLNDADEKRLLEGTREIVRAMRARKAHAK